MAAAIVFLDGRIGAAHLVKENDATSPVTEYKTRKRNDPDHVPDTHSDKSTENSYKIEGGNQPSSSQRERLR